MSEKIKAVVKTKTKTGKGFQLEGHENWFSANFVMAELAQVNVGDLVEITYAKKGVFFNVSKIVKVEAEQVKETEQFRCTKCGKVLKNNKFPTCWDCKSDPVEKEEPKSKVYDKPEGTKQPKSYDNPERTAQIQRGNALNAAAAVMSNPNLSMQDTSPEALGEATKVLADTFLDWLRAE